MAGREFWPRLCFDKLHECSSSPAARGADCRRAARGAPRDVSGSQGACSPPLNGLSVHMQPGSSHGACFFQMWNLSAKWSQLKYQLRLELPFGFCWLYPPPAPSRSSFSLLESDLPTLKSWRSVFQLWGFVCGRLEVPSRRGKPCWVFEAPFGRCCGSLRNQQQCGRYPKHTVMGEMLRFVCSTCCYQAEGCKQWNITLRVPHTQNKSSCLSSHSLSQKYKASPMGVQAGKIQGDSKCCCFCAQPVPEQGAQVILWLQVRDEPQASMPVSAETFCVLKAGVGSWFWLFKEKKWSKLQGRGKLGKERTSVPTCGFHCSLKDNT